MPTGFGQRPYFATPAWGVTVATDDIDRCQYGPKRAMSSIASGGLMSAPFLAEPPGGKKLDQLDRALQQRVAIAAAEILPVAVSAIDGNRRRKLLSSPPGCRSAPAPAVVLLAVGLPGGLCAGWRAGFQSPSGATGAGVRWRWHIRGSWQNHDANAPHTDDAAVPSDSPGDNMACCP
jgi:hypothetical protein